MKYEVNLNIFLGFLSQNDKRGQRNQFVNVVDALRNQPMPISADSRTIGDIVEAEITQDVLEKTIGEFGK